MKRKISIFLSFLMVCTLLEAFVRVSAAQIKDTNNNIEYLEANGMQDKGIQNIAYQDTMAARINVGATALYKASLGTWTHAIQSFYINGSEIYICQNYDGITFNGQTYTGNCVLLSRCVLSGNTFSIVDSMLLRNVGHGQTLDMYTYGGTTYFLISCGAAKADNGDTIWSTQIGRITYQANTVLDNSSIKRLTYLNYSNKNNTSFGATRRVDAALSSDKTKLLIWKRSQSGSNQFSVYDFAAINQQLSASSGNTVSFQNNATLKNACKFTINNPTNMPTSVQGVELSNLADGIHSIYVASGNEAKGQALTITRFNTNGNFKKQVTIVDTGVWGIYNRGEYSNALAEIEGVKIAGESLQFVLRDTDNKNRQVIAYIDKSLLK